MIKILSALFLIFSSFTAPVLADVYMKSRGMNGMAEVETWTSGKKQRTSVDMPMVGEIITITRADKGLQWEINTKLRVYEERPLALAYSSASGDEDDADLSEMQKMAAEEQDEGEESKCLTTKTGERVFAGYTAQGFSTSCGRGSSTTLWIAEANQGKLKEIKKEMDAFSAAQLEATYVNYPEKERKKIIETLQVIGTAMAQGLMGMPDPKDLPKDGFPLGMEGGGGDEDGRQHSMMLMEVTAIEQVPQDASRYELPQGFTLTENMQDYMAQQMIGQMASGETNLSDMMKGFGAMAERMGIPSEEMEGEAMTSEDVQMMNQMGQGTAQFLQAEMAAQSPRRSAPLPTDAPVEPWQQNLYSQAPAVQAYPQKGIPAAYGGTPAQGYSSGQPNTNPYAQGRRVPQGQAQPVVDPQSLQQIQQILGTVQGLVQGGGYTGGMDQLYQGYEQDGDYEDYSESYLQDYEGDSGDYYAE